MIVAWRADIFLLHLHAIVCASTSSCARSLADDEERLSYSRLLQKRQHFWDVVDCFAASIRDWPDSAQQRLLSQNTMARLPSFECSKVAGVNGNCVSCSRFSANLWSLRFCPRGHDRFVWRAKRAAANHPTTIPARDHRFTWLARDRWQPISETLDNRLVQTIAL